MADYNGKTSKGSFVENPNIPPYGPFDWSKTQPNTIQQYQFKSANKPFICFEPGNEMVIRFDRLDEYNRASGCNHFPVGQARCDGRTTLTSDKPSHCTSFPISEPVLHVTADREYWNGLYGMNGMRMEELVRFGRSWAYAPELKTDSKGVTSKGYDRSERCYTIENESGKPGTINFTLQGTTGSPVANPAIRIKNWNGQKARVLVNGKPAKDYRIGFNRELYGTDLVVFITTGSDQPMAISIQP
jgi:hypothetical protein